MEFDQTSLQPLPSPALALCHYQGPVLSCENEISIDRTDYFRWKTPDAFRMIQDESNQLQLQQNQHNISSPNLGRIMNDEHSRLPNAQTGFTGQSQLPPYYLQSTNGAYAAYPAAYPSNPTPVLQPVTFPLGATFRNASSSGSTPARVPRPCMMSL